MLASCLEAVGFLLLLLVAGLLTDDVGFSLLLEGASVEEIGSSPMVGMLSVDEVFFDELQPAKSESIKTNKVK